ncbi:exodeoxyribonuclease VII large subunit [Candidatus Aerophobetes bacterium]|uniref:Exodeoxyribonuclease 7 large subunit n=1 Tax=Aerophobetes bacterium TaxID=2030807 RepID=A0A2A4X9L5_UNCAE|nr:MAG: exodeoxyribonuclease VII large subunit [Candidatus Aerophobetes bacterium]
MLTQDKPYTVTALSKQICEKVEPFFYAVCVTGEVTNITRQSSGHLYFSIKDERSQLNVVMFQRQASLLKTVPKSGDKVIIKGSIKLYSLRSVYQLVAYSLTFSGLGDALILLQQRKEKFEKLGWFSKSLKKPFPPFPKKIGVVTSATGAAVRDILQILERRYPFFHVLIYPALVQGEKAAVEIARGIETLSSHSDCDVIIVARGGGSFEDLYAFNEEVVIQAVHACKLPLISAVGHETDTTLIDFISDKREPTPSAAAQTVCQDFAQFLDNFSKTSKQIHETMQALIVNYKREISQIKRHPCFAEDSHYLFMPMQALDQVGMQIQSALKNSLMHKKERLQIYAHALKPKHLEELFYSCKRQFLDLYTQIETVIKAQREQRLVKFSLQQKHLEALSPLKTLGKGYAIAFCENKQSVILDSRTLTPGDTLNLRLSKGEVKVKVMEIQE